jgi:tungstate transport system ATP-binding protein
MISLTIAAGRRLIVLGANGAGKSLFLRLCHGLIEPTEGQGSGPRRGAARGAGDGASSGRCCCAGRWRRTSTIPLALRGMSGRTPRTVAQTLDRFGLAPLADRPARLLSGGEQQRLALARAWAMQPQVLFIDEPSPALDPSATRIIEEMIERFSDEGITIVMTTHDLGQARRLAEDVAFLHRGRLIEHGPGRAFFAGPQTPEARAFLAGDLSGNQRERP